MNPHAVVRACVCGKVSRRQRCCCGLEWEDEEAGRGHMNCRNSVAVRVMHTAKGNVQDLRNARHGLYNDYKSSVAGWWRGIAALVMSSLICERHRLSAAVISDAGTAQQHHIGAHVDDSRL